MKPGHTGITRIIRAFGFSLKGLAAAVRHESAFRQELAVLVLAIPVGLYVGSDGAERALLVGSVLLVPVVELLNTGLETVVDRVSEGEDPLSGRAKDLGSAAVLMSIVLAAAVWALVLFG